MTLVEQRVHNTHDFRRIRSEVKPFTRELAQKFHDMEPSPTERELSPGRVKHLASLSPSIGLRRNQKTSAKRSE